MLKINNIFYLTLILITSNNLYSGASAKYCPDFLEVLNKLETDASNGNVNAQKELAKYYEREMIWWLQNAAKNGDKASQYKLIYLNKTSNKGILSNYPTGFKWLKEIADEEEVIEVQNIVGNMYAEGIGVPKNNEKALEYLYKAAESGHEKAHDTIKKILRANKDLSY